MGSEVAITLATAKPKLIILAPRNKAKINPVLEAIRGFDENVQTAFVQLDLLDNPTVIEAVGKIKNITPQNCFLLKDGLPDEKGSIIRLVETVNALARHYPIPVSNTHSYTMSAMATTPHGLTTVQLDRYLEYIGLPQQFRRPEKPELNAEFLTALHIHHIAAFPYENLSLHYTKSVDISLDVQHLYQKFLRNGRGGYCMETSVLFNHILRGLGFRAYLTGARIRPRKDGIPQGPYSGWCHVVNIIVLPDGSRYSCDVGFGGDGPTKPLPLISGNTIVNLGLQEVRFQYKVIPGYLTEPQKLWVYQYRNGATKPWSSFYAFGEDEWLPRDFEAINYWTSTYPGNHQTYTMLIVRFLKRPDSGIYGKVMLVNGDVKQNLGGKTSLLLTCKTEDERIEVLKSTFNITLTDEEREGIKGRVAELRSFPN
ncbi:hypothetical protein UA08_03361 [Talaromyces atroroseus]|uniref:Uncharacterized protein n=1 Tax=Talaromyces atroroseus TaxID=1441469 RepID=A0A225AJ09_TALAT|nr:hypothetical protein UA08_03361 [Talaromyces atroroseus]OKL60870.1 hypothetical protein UA08_03361 [Talaromyces atroroseus]